VQSISLFHLLSLSRSTYIVQLACRLWYKMSQKPQHIQHIQGIDVNDFLRQIAVQSYVQQQQQQMSQHGSSTATPPPAYNSPEMACSTVAASTPIITASQPSSFWSPRQPKAKKIKTTAAATTKKAKVPARVVAKPSASNPRGREGQSVGDFRCNIM
jgi:septal ring-binding cell division protein DamX